MKPEVLLERSPYRYVQCGTIELNGMPDYRIQKFDEWTKRYKDMYLLDNQLQLDYAMEDFEYTKWLDPDPEVGAYRKFNWPMSKYSQAEIAARDAVIQALYDNVPQNTLSELWRHYLGLRNIAETTEEKPSTTNVDLGLIDFNFDTS